MLSGHEIGILTGFIGVPLFIGFSGAFLTKPAIQSWYKRLKKAPWNPPNWVFGPVWTTLYILMGSSSFLVWREHGVNGVDATLPLAIYGINLILNAVWTPLFFGFGWFWVSLIEMIPIWITILACIIMYYPISATAAYLMVPYITWITLAFTLNLYVAINNPKGPDYKSK